MAIQTVSEQKIDKLPGGLTAAGVTSTSAGRQQYNGSGGTYFENPENVGTPQYKVSYSFLPSGESNIGTAENPIMVPTGSAAHVNYQKNIAPNQNPNNPITSGTTVRSDVTALGNDINTLNTNSNTASKLLNDRMKALETRRESEIASIRSEYDLANKQQEERQGKDYAGRATGMLATTGGYNSTVTGVLNNLRQTHENEKTALMGKRDSAISAAQSAYDDKQFSLAQSLIKEAKDAEQEIYQRTKDNANQELDLAREDRAQQKFDMGISENKIEAYSMMDDETFSKLTPSQLAETDKGFYSGYTATARDIKKKALEVKTSKDAIALDSDILDMRLKIPQGQKFVLGGQTYTGLKKPDAGSKATDSETFKSTLNYFRQNIFVPGVTIIGSDSVPFVEKATGYATKEGWKESIRISGIKRADFIDEFKQYLNPNYLSKYGLDGGEIKRITGLEPIAGQ